MNIFHKNCYYQHINSYISEVEAGNLKNLQSLFCVLSENSAKHKKIAAYTLCKILENSSEKEIYKIDECMRCCPLYYDTLITWSDFNIKDFITQDMTEAEQWVVLIFSSFNSSGYIREQAVMALADYKNTLPFILMRANDWVEQVREATLKSFKKSICRGIGL